jgi:hypothetical protein
MKTAVEWLQSQIVFESVGKKFLVHRWDEDSDLSEYFKQALQMEKEQKIEFAKLHVQKALKAVENEMILSASAVKHWYLPETIN